MSVLLATAAWLASCASSSVPMRFYTLTPMGTEGASANAPSAIRVVRVTLPGEIDRLEIVRRTEATRLQLAEEDRWAAPLGELIQRTLAADLQARVPSSAAEPDQLFVDIEEFVADANCAVTLRAAWTLRRAGASGTSTRGYETVKAEAATGCEVSAIPVAMSRALAEFSSRVAAARTK
jgi:uncharacterized lipoprotein YmbA